MGAPYFTEAVSGVYNWIGGGVAHVVNYPDSQMLLHVSGNLQVDGTVTFTSTTLAVTTLTASAIVSSGALTITPASAQNLNVTLAGGGQFAVNGGNSALSGITNSGGLAQNGALLVNSNSTLALVVGPNGTTNPTLRINAGVLNEVTGLGLTGAAASGGFAITTLSTAGTENLTIDALGSGTLTLNGTATGPIVTGSGLFTLGGNATFSGVAARTITGPGTGGLTVTVAAGPVTISTTASGTLTLSSAGQIQLTTTTLALNIQSGGSSALNLTAGGPLTMTGNGTSVWSVAGANLTVSTTTSGVLALSSAGNITIASAIGSTTTISGGNTVIATGTLSLSAGSITTLGLTSNTFAITANAGLTMGDATNIVLGTGTGTRIGTATNQLLSFYNAAPVAQRSAVGTATGWSAGSTVVVFHSDDTYTGNTGSTAYTINGIVAGLKLLGLFAS